MRWIMRKLACFFFAYTFYMSFNSGAIDMPTFFKRSEGTNQVDHKLSSQIVENYININIVS